MTEPTHIVVDDTVIAISSTPTGSPTIVRATTSPRRSVHTELIPAPDDQGGDKGLRTTDLLNATDQPEDSIRFDNSVNDEKPPRDPRDVDPLPSPLSKSRDLALLSSVLPTNMGFPAEEAQSVAATEKEKSVTDLRSALQPSESIHKSSGGEMSTKVDSELKSPRTNRRSFLPRIFHNREKSDIDSGDESQTVQFRSQGHQQKSSFSGFTIKKFLERSKDEPTPAPSLNPSSMTAIPTTSKVPDSLALETSGDPKLSGLPIITTTEPLQEPSSQGLGIQGVSVFEDPSSEEEDDAENAVDRDDEDDVGTIHAAREAHLQRSRPLLVEHRSNNGRSEGSSLEQRSEDGARRAFDGDDTMIYAEKAASVETEKSPSREVEEKAAKLLGMKDGASEIKIGRAWGEGSGGGVMGLGEIAARLDQYARPVVQRTPSLASKVVRVLGTDEQGKFPPNKTEDAETKKENISVNEPGSSSVQHNAESMDPANHESSVEPVLSPKTSMATPVKKYGFATIPQDGLRSNPVRISSILPGRPKRKVTWDGTGRGKMEVKPGHRSLRQSIVSTPYPDSPQSQQEERTETVLGFRVRGRGLKKGNVVVPGKGADDAAQEEKKNKVGEKGKKSKDFDDAALFRNIKAEYVRVRGRLRLLVSARHLSGLEILAHTRSLQVTTPTRKRFLGGKALQRTNCAEARFMEILRAPRRGRERFEWVKWARGLPQYVLAEEGDEGLVAFEFIEGWDAIRIAFAVAVAIFSSIAATVLWIFLGIDGGASADLGILGHVRATRTGFRGAGGRVETGFVMGVLVLLLGWTGIGAWLGLSWIM